MDVQELQVSSSQGDEVPVRPEVWLYSNLLPTSKDLKCKGALPACARSLAAEANGVPGAGGRPRALRRKLLVSSGTGDLERRVGRGPPPFGPEVREDAVLAWLRQDDRGRPRPIGGHLRVNVLKAGEVAPHHDQVHLALVLGLEVGERAAILADDPESQHGSLAEREVSAMELNAEARIGIGIHLGVVTRRDLVVAHVAGPILARHRSAPTSSSPPPAASRTLRAPGPW